MVERLKLCFASFKMANFNCFPASVKAMSERVSNSKSWISFLLSRPLATLAVALTLYRGNAWCASSDFVWKDRPKFVTDVKLVKDLHTTNTSLKKLKHRLAGFDVVVKEKTIPTAITEGVKPSTSASGSQPSGITKKDKIRQTPSSTQKNKVDVTPSQGRNARRNEKGYHHNTMTSI
ncbi:hypothetical protein Tco_0189102 [Tanacetum coccineum]